MIDLSAREREALRLGGEAPSLRAGVPNHQELRSEAADDGRARGGGCA